MVSCPTGALTNKFVVGTALGREHEGTPATVEELLALPVFQNVSGTFLELNRNAVVKRHFRRGEIICREGEFGSTAFYILEGKVSVSISTPIAHVKTSGGERGFFSKLGSFLVGRDRDDRAKKKWIGARFRSTRRWTSITTIPSPNSGPAISSAK